MQRILVVVALSLAALPSLGAAQQQPTLTPASNPPTAPGAGGALATREFLQAQLAQLGAGSPAAAMIRVRLETGDFQMGDRIFVRVQAESLLTDTFTVAPGPALVMPQVGSLTLTGVLRSELHDRLTQHLAKYLRDPVVEVRPLMRILAEGEIGKPGFYAVAPELPLADVISVAGGLTQRAKVNDIRVERGAVRIWGGATLQDALARGHSLDQLNLRAGDRIYVPGRGDSERTLRILGILLGIPVTVVALTRVLH
jgi:polysaccharide export outer membrane protein